ncbi:MAG TPA: D-2-hydroxyacid dehydrogenase family protein [Paraburkholderia sp.]|jgi:phosphoglycerate dehydrogenase-like enzyme
MTGNQKKQVKVAVLDDFQNVSKTFAPWSELDASVDFFTDHVSGEDLIARLHDYDVAVVIRERSAMSRAVIERLPNLKLIATAGMRNNAIDLDACAGHGVVVCGTQSASAPTAELALGLMIALSRQIVAEDQALRQGRWQTRVGSSLSGKTLGIVGLGKLGAQMAAYARMLGMEVIAWSEHLSAERASAESARAVSKSELFRTADFVSLHLVLSERTRGTVGAAEFALMKPTAFLVNTSRAGLVDQQALVDALKTGKLGGAALDVFDTEPLPITSDILTAPNTILTPHLGYATSDTYSVYFPQIVEAIDAWLGGNPVRVLTAAPNAG